MSKGSRQRTLNHDKFLKNWDLIFKKKIPNEQSEKEIQKKETDKNDNKPAHSN